MNEQSLLSQHHPDNRDLFSLDSLHLPPITGDETLYSWCAHYHRLSSNASARHTSQQLFAHPSAGMRPDFPVRLNTLVQRTFTQLGSAQKIIFKYTVFGAFAPFLATERIRNAIESMRADVPTRITSTLGLFASRIGAPAPLKACPKCMIEDQLAFHYTRWHLLHQLPAVRICHKHEELLLVANEQAHARARHDFLLPQDLQTNDWHPNPPLTQEGFARLNNLVDWSSQLTIGSDIPYQQYDSDILRDTCHIQAHKLGWVTTDGSLRFKPIREAFHDVHLDLEKLPGLSFLEGATRENGGFIGILLRQYGRFQHPLKHLFLLAFFFKSPEEFNTAYRSAEAAPDARKKLLVKEHKILSDKLQELVAAQGMSVNQAAQLLGISVKLAITYLHQTGTAYQTRPRLLGTSVESELILRLQDGDDPIKIAHSLGIRRSFIKDYLAGRPELRATWAERRLSSQRKSYREHFLALLAENPLLPIKRIRRMPKSGFEWLYRNDRDWLAENLPAIWHR